MSNAKKKRTTIETFEEAVPVETAEESVVVCIGKVKDCDKLNVRSEPNPDAKVLCRLDKDAEVQIDKSTSTKDFYKITTASGVSGYCMKKYISAKKCEA